MTWNNKTERHLPANPKTKRATSSLSELKEVLSEDLQRELDALTIQFDATPTESEIRVAQAQLVGWLEGLFHGIQAALWFQQMQTKAQLQEMRRRALPSGSPGQYL